MMTSTPPDATIRPTVDGKIAESELQLLLVAQLAALLHLLPLTGPSQQGSKDPSLQHCACHAQ